MQPDEAMRDDPADPNVDEPAEEDSSGESDEAGDDDATSLVLGQGVAALSDVESDNEADSEADSEADKHPAPEPAEAADDTSASEAESGDEEVTEESSSPGAEDGGAAAAGSDGSSGPPAWGPRSADCARWGMGSRCNLLNCPACFQTPEANRKRPAMYENGSTAKKSKPEEKPVEVSWQGLQMCFSISFHFVPT